MRGRISAPGALALAWIAAGCGARTGLDEPPPEAGLVALDPVVEVPRATAAAHLTAGLFHTCAVRVSGEIWCWGFNTAGQLGDGTDVSRESPVRVAGIDDAILVRGGREHTCALRHGAAISCWGSNLAEQLGGATTDFRSTRPATLPSLGDVVDLAAGGGHTCALTSGGEVACWGDDSRGQLGGRASATHRVRFARPELPGVAQISAGWLHTCAVLDADGRVACWGENREGQLGAGALDATAVPVEVPGVRDAVQVAAGDHHTCAVLGSGAVWCWGRNDFGQLGDGTTGPVSGPVEVRGLDDAVEVAAGHEHTCALRRTGEVACWGRADRGQLGLVLDETYSPVPAMAHELGGVRQVAAGWRHACARRSSGEVLCWGRNVEGQLGVGTHEAEKTPTRVVGL